ncbi:MAG: hypothetical protein E6G92_07085 [Alphaproteobacteria bacterium]|nr:MAG: hypothetical protein E6G92_07085 [Alphaproteobacteria bacterium]
MRRLLPLASLFAAIPLSAQQPEASTDQPTIIVTGPRLQGYRDALARCLARHCPPNEDADATLALAEALFLDGAYHEGRDAVAASLRRNRDQTRGYPEPVSDLYRAHARLSRHLGEDEDGRRSTYGALRALQEGIPAEDHRHFTARLEVSEMQMQRGNLPAARRELQDLARVARAAGREDVATVAELRSLWFELIVDPQSDARARLIALSRLGAAADHMRATGARLLLARFYRGAGQAARADALLAEVGRSASTATRRQLIYSPPYQMQVQDTVAVRDTVDSAGMQGPSELALGNFTVANVNSSMPDNFEDKWIDVGFWIMPDGRVSGLEILRNRNNPDWADPLIESIRARAYSAGTEATYRMERYTYTAGYQELTGSHIRRRTRAARVEYLDLTTSDAPPTPPTSGGSI